MMKSSKKAAAACLTVLLMVIAVFTIGPRIETRFFPPYTRVNAVLIDISETHVDLLVTGFKSKTCILDAGGALVFNGDLALPGTVIMTKDNALLEKIDQRIITGSTFIRIAQVSPPGDRVQIDVEAVCHPFWKTSQRLIDIDLTETSK